MHPLLACLFVWLVDLRSSKYAFSACPPRRVGEQRPQRETSSNSWKYGTAACQAAYDASKSPDPLISKLGAEQANRVAG